MKIVLKYKAGLFVWIMICFVVTVRCQGPYKDGIYTAKSRAQYTNEPYVGSVKIKVRKGYIKNVEFSILDTLKNEKFDSNYAKYFEGNAIYVEQCNKDWIGVLTYPEKLLEKQNINDVDALSGATWSYNIFKQCIIDAIKPEKK